MPAPFAVSRLPVGSSARMMAGWPTRARAMATRWHSPPDSSPGRCAARRCSPTSASASAAARRRWARHAPVEQPGGHVVQRRQAGIRKNCWNTKPIRSARMPGQLAVGKILDRRPATRTVPMVGRSSVPAMASSVDFPDPDGPTTATSSPAPIVERDATGARRPGRPGMLLGHVQRVPPRSLAPPPPWCPVRCPPPLTCTRPPAKIPAATPTRWWAPEGATTSSRNRRPPGRAEPTPERPDTDRERDLDRHARADLDAAGRSRHDVPARPVRPRAAPT